MRAAIGPRPAGGGRTRFDVGEIFARFGARFRAEHALSTEQARVMTAMARCRTAALGGHVHECVDCGLVLPAYNSCRNRHCPKCQGAAQYRWVESRKEQLLNTGYFHVVFTLPAELRPLASRNRRAFYARLMRSAAQSRLTMGLDTKRLGGLVGVTAVLHTWSRTLAYHPHVHCIVTGGGLAPEDGRGAAPVVYAKAPFGGPIHVFRYLGAYTHRVGLANSRLCAVTEDAVTFRTRGENTTTLSTMEFIRRFLQHVLPRGFVKIRHYGLAASANVQTKHAAAMLCLGALPELERERHADKAENDPPELPEGQLPAAVFVVLLAAGQTPCPRCSKGRLQVRGAGGPDPP